VSLNQALIMLSVLSKSESQAHLEEVRACIAQNHWQITSDARLIPGGFVHSGQLSLIESCLLMYKRNISTV
jgi:hypothetical protein